MTLLRLERNIFHVALSAFQMQHESLHIFCYRYHIKLLHGIKGHTVCILIQFPSSSYFYDRMNALQTEKNQSKQQRHLNVFLVVSVL